MPADLPSAAQVIAIPYYRVVAFVAGGSATLVVLLVVGGLVQRVFAH